MISGVIILILNLYIYLLESNKNVPAMSHFFYFEKSSGLKGNRHMKKNDMVPAAVMIVTNARAPTR